MQVASSPPASPWAAAAPRRPNLPAVHRQGLLWLLDDLVRWIVAADQLPTYRVNRKATLARCTAEVQEQLRELLASLHDHATPLAGR